MRKPLPIGSEFGRLVTVALPVGVFVEVECDCGERKRVRTGNLRNGSVTSCGAHRAGEGNSNWRGGKTSHPLYWIYHAMLDRCRNPQHPRYADYGGRGIAVCPEWRDDFWRFVEDMGERPEGYLLDRVDNDAGYAPGNCRWVTPSESNVNRRPSHHRRERLPNGRFK